MICANGRVRFGSRYDLLGGGQSFSILEPYVDHSFLENVKMPMIEHD